MISNANHLGRAHHVRRVSEDLMESSQSEDLVGFLSRNGLGDPNVLGVTVRRYRAEVPLDGGGHGRVNALTSIGR